MAASSSLRRTKMFMAETFRETMEQCKPDEFCTTSFATANTKNLAIERAQVAIMNKIAKRFCSDIKGYGDKTKAKFSFELGRSLVTEPECILEYDKFTCGVLFFADAVAVEYARCSIEPKN